tara:strand:+ start:100 stop:354 length:255 start_codon:yes stop_codon:yes gene_type:complete
MRLKLEVGDRVIRTKGINAHMVKGDKGVVELISLGGYIRIEEFRGLFLHSPSDLKRVIRCQTEPTLLKRVDCKGVGDNDGFFEL